MVLGAFLSTNGLLILAFLGFENLLILFVLKTNKTKLIATRIKRINVILYIIYKGIWVTLFRQNTNKFDEMQKLC